MRNRSVKKRIFALLLALMAFTLCCCGKTPGTGGETAAESAGAPPPDGTDVIGTDVIGTDATAVEAFEIEYYGGTCLYSDGWFYGSAKEYSSGLALQSFALACSAFNAPRRGDYSVSDRYLNKFLSEAGFTGYRSDEGYSKKPTEYSIGAGFAKKAVGGRTLIAVAIRGGGYEREWYSNMDTGAEGDHRGFSIAAEKVLDELSGYIEAENITGAVSFWMTGYSRGGAVANLLAAGVVDGMLSEKARSAVEYGENDVFAYCISAPMGTVSPEHGAERYSCIHNVINPCDLVCRVPTSFFGFYRYGVDVYLPSPMTASDFAATGAKAIAGSGMRCSDFSVRTVGMLSRDIIEAPNYQNYNYEVFLDDLCRMLERCVPTRGGYFAESQAICEFIAMADDGTDLSGLACIAENGSASVLAAAVAAFGAGDDEVLTDKLNKLIGDSAEEKVKTAAIGFIVALSHLFGRYVADNLPIVTTLIKSIDHVVLNHTPDYCLELLRAAGDGVSVKREYALIGFDAAGDIEVYVDGVLSARLDGEYKTLTAVSSAIPYSVGGGSPRVFIPNGTRGVTVKILSHSGGEGRVAVVIRDYAGGERTLAEKTFSTAPRGEYSFTLDDPCS